MELLSYSCPPPRQLVSSRIAQDPFRCSKLACAARHPSFYGSSSQICLCLPSPLNPTRPKRPWSKILCSEDPVQEMKEMAAAEKRWRSQVRDGIVRAMSPKQAGYALQLSNHCLLDVRPSTERKKAWVKSSIWIPIFDVDKGFELSTLVKRWSNFMMGGWWSGVPLMKYNSDFLQQAREYIPVESNVIVACQKGLRSLAACEKLYKAGYKNLFWVEGGLEAAQEGDLLNEGPQPFKFAGIGGASEFLGWTEEQRAVGRKEGWTYRAVFFGRLVGIVLLVDALFIGGQQLLKH